jgi:Hsp20/alpha crystallin family
MLLPLVLLGCWSLAAHTVLLALQLPEDADLSGITARFRDGVLTVMIKRTKPAEPETTDVPIDDWFDVRPDSGEQA